MLLVGAMPFRGFCKGRQIHFKVVQSVFDEETATEVIKSYLQIIRDAELPEESKLTFKHCQFDSDSGISVLLLTFTEINIKAFCLKGSTLRFAF